MGRKSGRLLQRHQAVREGVSLGRYHQVTYGCGSQPVASWIGFPSALLLFGRILWLRRSPWAPVQSARNGRSQQTMCTKSGSLLFVRRRRIFQRLYCRSRLLHTFFPYHFRDATLAALAGESGCIDRIETWPRQAHPGSFPSHVLQALRQRDPNSPGEHEGPFQGASSAARTSSNVHAHTPFHFTSL